MTGVKAFGASTMMKNDTVAKMYFESVAKHYGVKIKGVKIKDLSDEFLDKILYGTGNEEIKFSYKMAGRVREYTQSFEGVIPILERRHNDTKSEGARNFYEMYMRQMDCDSCGRKET